MSRQLQLKRGTTTEHATFTGAVGEVTVDTTKDTVIVHDGTTAGGHPLSRLPAEEVLTGYTIAGTAALPAATDTVNVAIGKLAKYVSSDTEPGTITQEDSGTLFSVYPVADAPIAFDGTIVSMQAGVGDSTPTNVRAITGYPTLSITQSKKNLIPHPYIWTTRTENGVTFTVNANGSINVNGTATDDTYFAIIANTSKLRLPKGKYILSGCPTENADGSYLTLSMDINMSDTGNGVAITTFFPTDVYLFITVPNAASPANALFWPQLEVGSVATAFELNDETVHTITPVAPFYGIDGCEDLITISTAGAVSAVHSTTMITLDGTEEWVDTHFAASGYFELWIADNLSDSRNMLCSHFTPLPTPAVDSNRIMFYENMLLIYPDNTVATSKAEFLSWLDTNNVQVVYELDTPVIVSHTLELTANADLNVIAPKFGGLFTLTYNKSVSQSLLDIASADAASHPWKGKVWAAMGDSLTAYNWTCARNYTRMISDELDVDVLNLAYSGAGYMTYHDTGHAFYHQALGLTSDVDAITIFGSGNDLINIASLGLATDEFVPEALTICGCINHTIDVIQGLLPDTPIGIIAPTPWAAYNPNIPGNDMALYVAKLAEIASLRGLPYLDLYYHSNLRPWDAANAALCFISDFLHFNVRGNEVIHGQIREFVRSLI